MYPYSDRLDPSFVPDFFKYLALGVSWTFKKLNTLSIFLAYQQLDPELLLDICKSLKEDYAKNEKTLKRINIFQATDLFLVQKMRWNYVSLTHAGGKPLEILISSDSYFDFRNHNFLYFGPDNI